MTDPENWEVVMDLRGANVTFCRKQKKNRIHVLLTNDPNMKRVKMLGPVKKQAICKNFESHAMISKNQHGFVKDKSGNTNIVPFFDLVIILVDKANTVDIINLDFSKASDKVLQAFSLTSAVK